MITLAAFSACALIACAPLSNHKLLNGEGRDGSSTLVWQAITFGQSTDLNFNSTILPEKVGVNRVTSEGEIVSAGAIAPQFTLESRGGKIANSHDGGTFYYTTLPAGKNFTLSAQVTIEQFGPETNAAPNRQEGAGLMVRDVLGKARFAPQPQGLEEFPAASNMVMNLVRANEKTRNGLVNISATYREGIEQPWGTEGNRMSYDDFVQGVLFGPEHTYQLTLARTDEGYWVGYDDGVISRRQAVKGAPSDVVEVQDDQHQYVGFFVARNVKMTVSQVELQVSEGKARPSPRYHAEPVAPILQRASSTQSAVDDYNVQAQANYRGTFHVEQDGVTLIEAQDVDAGELLTVPTLLKQTESKFDVLFTPLEGENLAPLHDYYVVKKQPLSQPMTLYANPTGSYGKMTLDEAVKRLPAGGTIVLEAGDYPAFTLPISASGTPKARKTLIAMPNVRFVGDYVHAANYWDVSNIEAAGARIIVHGSHNHFSHMLVHGASDTGFQITSPEGIGRALWASHNIVTDSESFNHRDDSLINADGFAAKMRIGDGNAFMRCVSHHNADDGWDLFNKVEDGPNGVVTITDSIAYRNGHNGFKLGGEGLPVAHVIKRNLALRNQMDGFTDNFNPGALTVSHNIAIDNARFNYLFRKSPYADAGKQGTVIGNRSYRLQVESPYRDIVYGDVMRDNQWITDEEIPTLPSVWQNSTWLTAVTKENDSRLTAHQINEVWEVLAEKSGE